jgi:membrane-associated protease RseP (regulator of RpoE activity)
MLLGEPPPTQADLHFRLFRFPVRVHPFFWVIALLLTLGGGPIVPLAALVWVAVVFVSVLVHELGHAFMQRRYGGHPWITLYGMGGLTSCNDYDRRSTSQIIVLLAGPTAGFLMAAVVMLIILATGHHAGLTVLPQRADLLALLEAGNIPVPMPLLTPYFARFASMPMNYLIIDLLWVNVLWGMVNLLPIYPLDGGQIARELFTLGNARRGIIASLWLSIVVAGCMAAWGLSQGSIFIGLLFGYLAYTNYQTIRAYEQHWG